MVTNVEAAYTDRAAEYVEHLGTMASVHPSDVQLVSAWAAEVEGPLLDAGCGPGHWTAFLAEQGHDVHGIDSVPAFVDHARGSHPHVPFAVGSIDALDVAADTHGGVLAWYSLIHHDPGSIRRPLDEFARVLGPGGMLLVGFFVGPVVEAFDHAVVTAWRWPTEALEHELGAAGFDVVETHTRIAATGTPRPHGAVLARVRSSA
ncbi:class I SAM-dependent methyltransferase [Curtobacterium sp. APC 4022]|uniref:class I SAM-dependent methyltransferase n=1 Tax=Curtobacterium sp. APC 4022 TaxID=3035201 RepID=UPI0025B51441|nr:class I SAM-dependent methyltransferase [Curtobacterium sp. APC 4022]MDN3477361.1 methyltransferase domain-containing protein [Curtobacterium sp. APC 4022]